MAKKNKEQTAEMKLDSPLPQEDTQAKAKQKKSKDGRPHYVRAILLGLLLVLVAVLISGSLGYFAGIKQRKAEEENQRLTLATTHYKYGMDALASGNYEVARVQLEYVIQIYPEFPDIMEKYSQVVIALTKTQQATVIPTQTPTPDVRGAQALFEQAQTNIANQEWCAAVETLKTLRDEDHTYQTLTVDGMVWLSLRNCAIQKITKEGDLEGGLYDLSLAEKFAPLDHDAVNYASWARLYVTGASYWEVDWAQVVNFFSQVYAAFPYLHDTSGWTATDRYRIGLREYGKSLMSSQEYCKAQEQFQLSLAIQNDEEAAKLLNEATTQCQGPITQPTATIEETPPE